MTNRRCAPIVLIMVASLIIIALSIGCFYTTGTTERELAAPTFWPDYGSYYGGYSDSVNVEISTTSDGASIRYTTDESRPSSTEGILYTDPIFIPWSNELTILKAIAFKRGWPNSKVTTEHYYFK